jgi:carboxyl-terminal processing protease
MKKRITALLLTLMLCIMLLTPAVAAVDYADRAAEVNYYITKYSLAYKDSDYIPILDALGDILKDDPVLFERLVAAMFNRLDSYSEYMTEEEHNAAFSTGTTFVGIGISLDTSYPYGVLVKSVIPDSPAEEKGIRPGDIITSVDGTNVRMFKYHEIGDLVRGEAGTKVKMGILRQGSGNIVIELERRLIVSPNVTYEKMGDGVGIIRIGRFGNVMDYIEFVSAYNEFAADKEVKSIIIDVRGNPGGSADILYRMLNLMVPNSGVTLFKLVDSQSTEEFKSTGHAGHSPWKPDKMIVLVDEWSVSAAEVFAGSLQQLKMAEVVGTTTYGKARSQYHFDLSFGSVAVISSHEVLLPDGSMYEGKGITPDFIVNNDGEPYPLDTLERLNTSTPLYRGRTSNSILAMQQRLYALGLLPVKPDGYFGDITLWSLNVFQRSMGIRTTTHATAATLRALENEMKNARLYNDDQMEFALNRLKG